MSNFIRTLMKKDLLCGIGAIFLINIVHHASADITALSSQFESRYAPYASDLDPETCAETGHERGAWWVKRFDAPVNVTGIELSGLASAYEIRVGNDFRTHGYRGGFRSNPLCHFASQLNETQSEAAACGGRGLMGHVVSVQSVDPTSTDRLKLCHVVIHTA